MHLLYQNKKVIFHKSESGITCGSFDKYVMIEFITDAELKAIIFTEM